MQSFKIKHQGRTYKLYQRSEEAESPYYIRIQNNGVIHQRSCESHVKAVATTNAKLIIAAVKNEKWSNLQRALDGAHVEPATDDVATPTIAQVIQIYLTYGSAKFSTRQRNAWCLRRLLRAGLKTKEEDQLPCTVLNDVLIRHYARAYCEGIAPEKLTSRKRGANSATLQARSVFSNLSIYRDAGLTLPDLKKFLEEPVFPRVGKTDYAAPPDSLIQKTFAALLDLKTTDQNAYLAICLACGAGLRKGEIALVRRNSFVQRNGRTFIADTIQTKNNSPLDVPILEDWYQRILAVVPETSPEFLLSGTLNQRTQETFRRVGEWMRELGWKTQKTIHEFRAYVGSKVCDKHGIQVASQFLRHADISTTQRKYMRYVTMQNVDVTFGPSTI